MNTMKNREVNEEENGTQGFLELPWLGPPQGA